MKLKGWKRIALAVVAVVAGLGGEAQALEFGNGDLVLALYGNSTQYLRNLGQTSSVVSGSSPTIININPLDFAAVGSGTEPVKWALYGFSYDESTGNPTTFVGGASKQLSEFTPDQLSAVQISNSWNAAGNQSGNLSGDGLSVQLIPASNQFSFTGVFGTDGSMNGGWPVSMAGSLGSTLHLLEGAFNGNALSTVGYAILALDGSTLTLTAGVPAAVPLPAAVILFGSGLIGLVGIARRKMMQG